MLSMAAAMSVPQCLPSGLARVSLLGGKLFDFTSEKLSGACTHAMNSPSPEGMARAKLLLYLVKPECCAGLCSAG